MPTALIVEDEPEANRLLAMLVRLRGYQTDSAFTGGEALAKAESQPFDIVFLDLMLPDINGYEVCKKLKTERATSMIPVVMVTARLAAENRYQSYSAGAEDYIPKPYTPDQIFEAITNADAWRKSLDRHEAAGEFDLGADHDDALKELARLRGLLMARTSLGPDAVGRVVELLESLRFDAAAWAEKRRSIPVAMLNYRLEPGCLTVTITDRAGWLAETGRQVLDEPQTSLASAPFDSIVPDVSGRTVTFRRRFAATDGNGRKAAAD
jgi:CheY-like chemotaxis protein